MTADFASGNSEAFSGLQAPDPPLRIVICGGTGAGKSTLLKQLSASKGVTGEDQDASGDIVVSRDFSFGQGSFAVAELQGHEQYPQNMVSAASTADLVIVMIDAREGIHSRVRHEAVLANMLGIRNLVLAVNKMDAVEYDRGVFEEIELDFREFVQKLPNKTRFEAIPVSALNDDNVVDRSQTMGWYDGAALMSVLEDVDKNDGETGNGFVLPVQSISKLSPESRGFVGTVSGGPVTPGDRIKALPSARESTVSRIVTADGDTGTAADGQTVTLTLDDEIDVSRGDVICAASNPPEVADQFEATIVWMSESPMLAGRAYAFSLATNDANVTITALKHRINVDTMEEMAASELNLAEIGRCTISLDRRIPFTSYAENKTLGGFVIVDPSTGETLGMGVVHFALRRASNVHLQSFDVDREARARIKGQSAAILWFTGLSGSGKSTIADIVERQLVAGGHHTILLDGDNVRHGLNRDLGFTDADRVENIRRIGEVARLMTDAGLVVLVSFISPFASERRMARSLAVEGEFVEIYVSTPLEIAEARDVKGLYKKARAGEIKNFTGIDSPYEEPESAEIVVDTSQISAEDAADLIVRHLGDNGILKAG